MADRFKPTREGGGPPGSPRSTHWHMSGAELPFRFSESDGLSVASTVSMSSQSIGGGSHVSMSRSQSPFSPIAPAGHREGRTASSPLRASFFRTEDDGQTSGFGSPSHTRQSSRRDSAHRSASGWEGTNASQLSRLACPDANFTDKPQKAVPKVKLPMCHPHKTSFYAWSRQAANAMSGVFGVMTIVMALCQGDSTGAEPMLPPRVLRDCYQRSRQEGEDDDFHLSGGSRLSHSSSAFDLEYANRVCMTFRSMHSSKSIRTWIDENVKGRTEPHNNWSIYVRQLYGLLWNALDKETKDRVGADQGMNEIGNGVWLWHRLRSLIDPHHDSSIIQQLFSLISYVQGKRSFTQYYVGYRDIVSLYNDMCRDKPSMVIPHGVLVVKFVHGLSERYSPVVSSIIGMGQEIASLSIEEIKLRCEAFDRMFKRESRNSANLADSGTQNARERVKDKTPRDEGPYWSKPKNSRGLFAIDCLQVLIAHDGQQVLCWNCGSPDHKIAQCSYPCGICRSKSHKRVFDRKLKLFVCKNHPKGVNTQQPQTERKPKSESKDEKDKPAAPQAAAAFDPSLNAPEFYQKWMVGMTFSSGVVPRASPTHTALADQAASDVNAMHFDGYSFPCIQPIRSIPTVEAQLLLKVGMPLEAIEWFVFLCGHGLTKFIANEFGVSPGVHTRIALYLFATRNLDPTTASAGSVHASGTHLMQHSAASDIGSAGNLLPEASSDHTAHLVTNIHVYDDADNGHSSKAGTLPGASLTAAGVSCVCIR